MSSSVGVDFTVWPFFCRGENFGVMSTLSKSLDVNEKDVYLSDNNPRLRFGAFFLLSVKSVTVRGCLDKVDLG